MVSYVLRMMTSWAIVVNVWYLPPMTIRVRPQPSPNVHRLLLPGVFICRVLCEQEGEDAAQFASRVKSAIAHQGGLLDLPWWVHLLTDATTCWELSVLSYLLFSGTEASNDRKWRILTKRSSRRCTAASSWDRTAPHRTGVVKTQRTLRIPRCRHDHTTAGVFTNCVQPFYILIWMPFYKLLKPMYSRASPAGGSMRQHNRPVRLPRLPPSLSCQCDNVFYI